MTPFQDLFVGIAAAIFGCLLILGAITNSTPLMALAKPRFLAETLGKTRARWIIAILGAALVAIGVLIAAGWRIRW